MNILNYALLLEHKTHGYTAVNEAADMQTEDGLKKLLSGQNGGAYANQWDMLITDYEAKKGKAGTYKYMVKHDNGKDMIYVQYTIGSDGKPVKGSIKLAGNSAGSGTSTSSNEFKLSNDVVRVLNARAKYLANKTDVKEDELAKIFEAILYHATSNSLSSDQLKKLIAAVFTGVDTDSIYSAFDLLLPKAFIKFGQVNFDLENDSAAKKVISIVGSTPKIASTNITDAGKISELAQAIFDILDDSFVTKDEESIAAIGIVALNRASLYRLIKEWNLVHKANAGGKSISQYCAEEMDDNDSVLVFNSMFRGIAGTATEDAKAMLKSK